MKHLPQFAFYAAAALLLAGSFVTRSTTSAEGHRVALSVAMESGHLNVKAELGQSLLALTI